MGLLDGVGVRGAASAVGQGPVDAGQPRIVALALAGGDDQVGLDLLDGLAVRPFVGRAPALGTVLRLAADIADQNAVARAATSAKKS